MSGDGLGGLPQIEDDLRFVERLGFAVVAGEGAGREPPARLLIALRDHPTLAHFDPEWILAWITRDGRGTRLRIERGHAPGRLEFAWGTIRTYDRLDESNAFVTFGGTLEAVVVSPVLTVVRFASPAPILRWAGHSQPIDARAADVEAFFARTMIPIDFMPGAEGRFNSATPLGRYAAMVSDFAARVSLTANMDAWRQADPSAGRWAISERARLRADHADSWAEGAELLARLGLSRPAPTR